MTDRSDTEEEHARRRRRLAALGQPMAVSSADETDEGWSEPRRDREASRRDDEFVREVPPHHD